VAKKNRAREITIDARMLGYTGIGTYLKCLLEHLAIPCHKFKFDTLATAPELLKFLPADRFNFVRAISPIYSLSEQWEILRLAHGSPLLHCPHYNVPLAYRGRLIVTIHDLIHVDFPEYAASLSSRIYARPMLKLAASKARHIIADSEFTKSQIVEYLGASSGKITVVLLGVEAQFNERPHQEAVDRISKGLGVARPYLLFVSNLKPHKNLEALLKAITIMRGRKRLDHMLVVLGDDRRWRDATGQRVAELGLSEHVRIVPHVDSELLPWLYAGAEAFVMPSLIEGFGLPVLEAMACGTPVICSRAASLPEVGGDAVMYFDPHSPEELAAAIEKVLSSSDLQSEMKRKGLARAKLFSWEECARKHLEIYRRILE
jgi:glycosyltransferase involved in cell wall biosynthesis